MNFKKLPLIMLATLLGTTVSCSNSGTTKGGSNDDGTPDLTGYWKGACETYSLSKVANSGYYFFQIVDETTQKTFYAEFASNDCSGSAVAVYENDTETLAFGTVLSTSPWTQEFDYTRCGGGVQEYSTLKYENGVLYVADGDGSTPELRAADFTSADSYTSLAAEDVPTQPEPMKLVRTCLE